MMRAELKDAGVELLALSKDSVQEAAVHKERDGLALTLLADPELEVIRRYGLEHHKALNFKTGTFMIGTVPLAFTPSFKTMAIPTTLLVDENGVIKWIDQADDYRVRSDDDRVREALKSAFGA